MIDIHSHILPGIDDGPDTIAESLALAEKYKNAGFSAIIATPHAIPGTAWMPAIEIIREKINTLNASLADSHIDITIFPGMEISLDSAVFDLIDKQQIMSLAEGPYLLIEMPFMQIPLGWDQIFFNLMSRGYQVILAHPERCEHLIRKPELFDEIVETGLFLQVNYDSFLGVYGRGQAETAFFLADKGYIHCLATDSHNVSYRSPEHVHKVISILNNRIGSENTDIITRKNPERVISGKPLLKTELSEGKKKKGWRENLKEWLRD